MSSPGLPRSGLPLSGLPRSGLPSSGLPRSGLPCSGLPLRKLGWIGGLKVDALAHLRAPLYSNGILAREFARAFRQGRWPG